MLPTPGVAHLTASTDVDLGVVISASHNPMPDNGIKFFARGGFKLDDAIEDEIEARPRRAAGSARWARTSAAISADSALADRNYIDHLVAAAGTDLHGLRIAVDCANGAASDVAPLALREAGADVVVINASPDGRNINRDCGSTHPEQLQAVTVGLRRRVRAWPTTATPTGASPSTTPARSIDGDQIMGLLATAMKADGTLAGDTLVVTVMSNLGLLLAMKEAGIATVQTGVGDRYVLEAMRAGGYTLGGEQSGHVINADHATTGDGILTSLLLAAQVARTGRTLADLASVVDPPAAGARQRRRAWTRPARPATRAWPTPSPPSRPSWARPAGCCCAPPAPSRSCASWSRPARRSRPTPPRTGSPGWCATAWPCEGGPRGRVTDRAACVDPGARSGAGSRPEARGRARDISGATPIPRSRG